MCPRRHHTDPFFSSPEWIISGHFLQFLEGTSTKGLNIKAERTRPAVCLRSSSCPCLGLAVLSVSWVGLFIHLLHTDMSVFILDQSVCLFIRGFDHSTPWPPGSNYPAAIRFAPSLGKFSFMFLSVLNCSPDSFSSFKRTFLSLEFSPTVESLHCLMIVWVPN